MHSMAVAKEHSSPAEKIESNPSKAVGAVADSFAAFGSLLDCILAHCLQRSQSSEPGFGCWFGSW